MKEEINIEKIKTKERREHEQDKTKEKKQTNKKGIGRTKKVDKGK